jgi:putative tryptophan/tyrosine transport system substrate-binding protein
MRRRDCIALLGSAAAAWPLAAQAQQAKTPVVGYLGIASREDAPDWFAGLRKGLQESGFIEGQNINIEYRSTKDQFNRFPEFAAELVRSGVDVIFAADNAGALALPKKRKQRNRFIHGQIILRPVPLRPSGCRTARQPIGTF